MIPQIVVQIKTRIGVFDTTKWSGSKTKMCFDANEDPSSKLREFALIPNERTVGVKNGYDGITARKSSEIVFPKETVKRKM